MTRLHCYTVICVQTHFYLSCSNCCPIPMVPRYRPVIIKLDPIRSATNVGHYISFV